VEALPEEGSTLAGRYRVGQTIGRGGMGVVVEATHLQLGTRVAIKVLRKEALEEPTMLERFLREARSAAQLRGEHVCRVTDFGTTDDGIPFMVMEHLDGEDLKTIVDHGGPLDGTQTAGYILQACIGVAEAHALGIVHRDLKPGNLFLARGPDGRKSIKLLDFGIAKSTATTIDGSLTSTTKAMGSPAYMSPEQLMASTTLDARSDVWSLGVTMFELLTEQRPFDGDTPYELALRIANDPAAPLPDTVSAELAKVVTRCLTKDREKRYQNVADLAAALAPLVKNGKELAASVRAALVPPNGDTPRANRVSDTPSPATETTLRGASGAVTADTRSRSRILIPLALMFTTLAIVVGVMWWQSRGSDGTATQGATTPQPVPPAPTPPPPPAVDAAPMILEPDAAVEEIDAASAVTPDPDVEKKPKTRPKTRPKTPPVQPKDFGDSRF
jgi:eukaryotic-like serine/threonine-protein kinase